MDCTGHFPSPQGTNNRSVQCDASDPINSIVMAVSTNKCNAGHRRGRGGASCPRANTLAVLLLSISSTSAFAPTMRHPSEASRVGVVRRYRVEGEDTSDMPNRRQPQEQSAHSFLPSRLSNIELVSQPSQFQTQVLEEKDALVVVRFYAQTCPSCRSTRPFFSKWSRDLESIELESTDINNKSVEIAKKRGSQYDPLPIKIIEMPLNKDTSTFIKDELQVEQLPYCHLYHPDFGMVEEQLVLNRQEFDDFVGTVECWSKGGCEAGLEGEVKGDSLGEIEFESNDGEDCEEFC